MAIFRTFLNYAIINYQLSLISRLEFVVLTYSFYKSKTHKVLLFPKCTHNFVSYDKLIGMIFFRRYRIT